MRLRCSEKASTVSCWIVHLVVRAIRPQLVHASRFVRKLRGGAQSHLIQADDGHYYAVKFRNNPQHRRTLVNEWLAGAFLQFLSIETPKTAVVSLSSEFLAQNPEIHIEGGSERKQVEPGLHFGSRYPVNPERVIIHDVVPEIILEKVANIRDYLGVLVFDRWASNTDARQSIFFRGKPRSIVPFPPEVPPKIGYVTVMLDHGYVFNGQNWQFSDGVSGGLFRQRSVYQKVRSLDDFQPWLELVRKFPEHVISDALKSLPLEWIAEDGGRLEHLIDRLLARRRDTADFIQCLRDHRPNPFPEWR